MPPRKPSKRPNSDEPYVPPTQPTTIDVGEHSITHTNPLTGIAIAFGTAAAGELARRGIKYGIENAGPYFERFGDFTFPRFSVRRGNQRYIYTPETRAEAARRKRLTIPQEEINEPKISEPFNPRKITPYNFRYYEPPPIYTTPGYFYERSNPHIPEAILRESNARKLQSTLGRESVQGYGPRVRYQTTLVPPPTPAEPITAALSEPPKPLNPPEGIPPAVAMEVKEPSPITAIVDTNMPSAKKVTIIAPTEKEPAISVPPPTTETSNLPTPKEPITVPRTNIKYNGPGNITVTRNPLTNIVSKLNQKPAQPVDLGMTDAHPITSLTGAKRPAPLMDIETDIPANKRPRLSVTEEILPIE